ncbi:hypothetical protein GF367_04470 [Candidatus Woesearchaeota archaeon]|nr:hypothetical protein [Candidatus Woesearchaeota archaeon]
MYLSITTEDDNTIALSCRPGGVVLTNETNGGDDDLCAGFSPDGIIVRNDGSFEANVSVNMSDYGEIHGGSFLDATTNNSWVAFKIANTTAHENYTGGCYGFIQSSWVNVTSNALMTACDRLAFGPDNSFTFDMAFFIPTNTTRGDNNLTISFWASLTS